MRLILLYMAIDKLVAMDSHLYLIPHHTRTRLQHVHTFQHISSMQNNHCYAFYPRTILL